MSRCSTGVMHGKAAFGLGRFRATLIDPQHALLDGMALIETLAVR